MPIGGTDMIAGDYPDWICRDCGTSGGKMRHTAIVSTFHDPDPRDNNDICGWCGASNKPLTEPRDYGYPVFKRRHDT
jgi:hypothetical protein